MDVEGKKLRNLLEWHDGTETYIARLISKVQSYDSIVIFGAGIGGRKTIELLYAKGYGKKVKVFSDNNPEKIGKSYCGYPCIAPEKISEYRTYSVVLISSTAYDIIKQQLMKLGVPENDIYFFQPAGVSLDSNEDARFIKEHIVKFEEAYEMLADEKSRFIFRLLLNYRITKDIAWLEDMRAVIDLEKDQYFDKAILEQYIFNAGFVDAGAYIGDTVDSFYEHFPDWKGKYYCFEASEDIHDRLSLHVEKTGNRNIRIYNYALWSEKGELRFDISSLENGGGRIGEDGLIVQCEALDNIVKSSPVDFIKMDIEGAEQNALRGGVDTIIRNRPILAICIYHKPEDFFEIPLLIEGLVPDEYTYYIRQYRYGQSETVLYAMPKSRKKMREK